MEQSDIAEHTAHLTAFVIATKAQFVVELGTRTGVSTRAFAEGIKRTGGRLLAIDIQDCRQHLEGVPCEFIQGDDMTVELPHNVIDILFIDTSHKLDHTFAELERWVPCVREGGFILLHDMNCDMVLEAVRNFCTKTGYQYLYDQRQNGLGVILKCL